MSYSKQLDDRTLRALLVALSAGAGAADALMLLRYQVFPANMTGNTVVLALGVSHANSLDWIRPLTALFGFVVGAIVGILLTRNQNPGWNRRNSESLLFAAALVGIAWGVDRSGAGDFVWLVIGLVSVAMGLQASAIAGLRNASVPTNVVTGAIVKAIEGLLTKKVIGLPMVSWIAYLTGALVAGALQKWSSSSTLWLPALVLSAVACIGWRRFAAR